MKQLLTILLIAVLAGCNSPSDNFTIKGNLASSSFDGEWIYLVPMIDPSLEKVDSAKIENASFVFKGNVERVSVLRTKPALRIILQPLLVVTEPGTIEVKIDSLSFVGGTPQNNALQAWKEEKEKINKSYSFISKSLANSSSVDSLKLIHLQDSLKKHEANYNYQFLKKQGNNTVGKFVYQLVSPYLSKKQQKDIDEIQK